MAGLDAAEVARLLVEFGRRMELAGENPYRARAYGKAAEGLVVAGAALDGVGAVRVRNTTSAPSPA